MVDRIDLAKSNDDRSSFDVEPSLPTAAQNGHKRNGAANHSQNAALARFDTSALKLPALNKTTKDAEQPQTQRRSGSWWQGLSVRTKATALAVVVGTAPVLVIGAIAYYFANQSIAAQIEQDRIDRASQLANEINVFMSDRFADIQLLSQLPIFTDPSLFTRASAQQKVALLDNYVNLYGVYNSVALFNLNGDAVVQAQGAPVPNHKDRDYFERVVQTGLPTINPPSISRTTGTLSMHLAAPVKDSAGRLTGVVRFQLPVAGLEKIADEYGTEGDNYYVIDSNGKYFLASGNAERINQPAADHFPKYAQLQAAQKPGSVIDVDPDTDNQQLLTYVPLKDLAGLSELDYGILIASDVRTAFAAQRQLLLTLEIGIAITTLLVGVIAAIIANRATRPLVAAVEAVERIGQGDLDTRLDVEGQDEIASLGTNINNMAGQLGNLVQEQASNTEKARLLAKITGSRTISEQDLKNVFDETVESVREILKTDRVVVYRFKPNWSGYISSEAVLPGFPRSISFNNIEDPCIPQSLLDEYRNNRVVANTDVSDMRLHPEHVKLLERLQIKANLVVPILQQNQLFGLLIAHHCAKTHAWQSSEISFFRQVSAQLGVVLDRVTFIQGRESETERSQILRDITIELTQAKSPKEILTQLPIAKIRQALKADRVVVYRFDKQWKGTVTAESVGSGFPRALGAQIHDPCFEKDYVEKYKQGRVQATPNIYEAGLTDCHISQLEPYAVKANLVAPIKRGDQLIGLLIAHQCSGPRVWEKTEIAFFTQVTSQIELALDRCDLLEQRRVAAEQSRMLAEEQRQQKESLQRQLVELLGDVEGAAMGDLTVRADVTAGEIGTVADFFNSIIESLRQIVTKVKQSAVQVNSSLGANEGAVRQLADEALQQAEETNRILDSVEQMTMSIQTVAESARQAASVARTASTTAESSGTAMDMTVQNILNLRETVAETAKKVKRLGESSQQISKVVSLINQIALQTNLLSINAGIEAARAGEDGQGFAVVAEEIGALAARSAAATQEIEKIVDNIQTETSQVVEAMEQSTTQVVEGTRLVGEAKQSLGQILDVSRQIDRLVQSISEATVSQVQTSKSVSTLMQEVAQISERTSSSSLQISNALRETVQVAQELQESVGTFKVGSEA